MVEFRHVHFCREDRPVIDGMSFSIGQGERVAVLGGSGAGKTTLLKLIMGLLRPDSGHIYVDRVDLTLLEEEMLRPYRMRFSITFQEGALFDSLSVKENVAFYLREYTRMSEEQIDTRVRDLLRRVGVEHAIHMMPEELSGGMQRRVSIARSLAAREPAMFLYDEPTSDLDPVNAGRIRRLIEELASGGRGFIIVTHEMVDALKVAQRFLFVKNGRILFDGDREAFLASPLPDLRAFIEESHAS